MTFRKKVIRKRGLFLEYPEFEGDGAELPNEFEKRLTDLAAGASERFARCSLTTLCVTFKGGFIVKFEEIRK